MKIFVFGIRGFPLVGGGAERHSEELYPRLYKLGHDITVLTRRYYFDTWEGVKFKKIPYIDNTHLETISHSILCSLYAFWKKPDLVHIHNMGACLLVPFLVLRGIKVVVTLHSFNYRHKKWGHFARYVLNFCESMGVNFAHKIITVSREMRNFLITKYNRYMYIDYISNAVKPADFVAPNLILKKYNLEPKKYALSVGRLVPEKGFDKLIEAYKIAKPMFKLVIVGEGNTQYATDLKKEKTDNIIFTGYLCGKELAELYSNAGLMILSSFQEGFPLVFLEALSYNLPILASNIETHKHIKLESYRYYTVDNVKELALKMRETFNFPYSKEETHLYKNLLENEYNWDKIARDTNTLYGAI